MKDIQPIIQKEALHRGMDLEELRQILDYRYGIRMNYWSWCFLLQHPHRITTKLARAISEILCLSEDERRKIFLRFPK